MSTQSNITSSKATDPAGSTSTSDPISLPNPTNPLVFTSIKNNISGDKYIKYKLDRLIQNSLINDNPKYLDNILRDTTLKRACCLGLSSIPVRIPIPVPNTISESSNEAVFGYYKVNVPIPPSMCGKLDDGNGNAVTYGKNPVGTLEAGEPNFQCKNFYNLYCANMNYLLDEELSARGQTYKPGMLNEYSPECSCFERFPANLIDPPPNTPKSCYATNCEKNQNTYWESYFECKNPVNFCSIINNLITGDVTNSQIQLNPQVKQTCGSELKSISNIANSTNANTNTNTNTNASNPTGVPLPNPTTPETQSKPAQSNPAQSDSTKSDTTKSDTTKSDTTKSDSTKSNPSSSGETPSSMPILWIILAILLCCVISACIYFFVIRKKAHKN